MMRPTTMPRLQLAALVASLLWLWHSCGTVAAGADEVARIPVDRPAVVIVERTEDGGIRVILEFRPRAPGPKPDGPGPIPIPQPPSDLPPSVIALVDRALEGVDPESRPGLARLIADELAATPIRPEDSAEDLGQLILSRLVARLGIEYVSAAVLIAAGVGDDGPMGDRPLDQRVAALRAALMAEVSGEW